MTERTRWRTADVRAVPRPQHFEALAVAAYRAADDALDTASGFPRVAFWRDLAQAVCDLLDAGWVPPEPVDEETRRALAALPEKLADDRRVTLTALPSRGEMEGQDGRPTQDK